MEKNIIFWIDQNELFGLDFSTSKARIGDYTFDIRYDCDSANPREKPNNCGVSLRITYRGAKVHGAYSNTVERLKIVSETWFKREVVCYYKKYCILYEEFNQ